MGQIQKFLRFFAVLGLFIVVGACESKSNDPKINLNKSTNVSCPSVQDLFDAARGDCMTQASALIAGGANVNEVRTDTQTGSVFTPLVMAIRNNYEDMAVLFINHGADIHLTGVIGCKEANIKGRDSSQCRYPLNPLQFAAKYGLSQTVAALLKAGAVSDINSEAKIINGPVTMTLNFSTPLELNDTSVDTAKLLIASGAKVVPHLIHFATAAGSIPLVQFYVIDQKLDVNALAETSYEAGIPPSVKIPPIDLAVFRDDAPMITALAQLGANVNLPLTFSCSTPVQLAVMFSQAGSPQALQALINAKADIAGFCLSTIESDNNPNPVWGWGQIEVTPLDIAADHSYVADAKILLDAGFPIGARNSAGLSAIHFAKSAEMVDYLVSAGASLTEIDKLGNTPSMNMIRFERYSLKGAKRAIELGADPLHRNNSGFTMLHFVSQLYAKPYSSNSEDDILQFMETLLSAGVNVNAQSPSGITALQLAAFNFAPRRMQLLLEKGADPNIISRTPPIDELLDFNYYINAESGTALHWIGGFDNDYSITCSANLAGLTNVDQMIQLLLDHGANMEVLDSAGETPFQRFVQISLLPPTWTDCLSRSLPSESQYLLDHGADPNKIFTGKWAGQKALSLVRANDS